MVESEAFRCARRLSYLKGRIASLAAAQIAVAISVAPTRPRSTASRSSAIGQQNLPIGIQYGRRLEHLGCAGRIDSRPEKTLFPNRATAERIAHPSFAANGNDIHRPRSPQFTHHYCNRTSGDQRKKDSYCAEKSGLEALIANNRLIYQVRNR